MPDSFKVGYTVEGSSCRNVYEALREIECTDCGRAVGRGERFTRHKVQGGGPALYPMCADCEPISDFRSDGPENPPRPGEQMTPNPGAGHRPNLGSL